MALGFALDYTYGGQRVSTWSAGSAKSSYWRGVKVPDSNIPIGTFRCELCGFLESYALPEFAAK
jgi:hypothetical protein